MKNEEHFAPFLLKQLPSRTAKAVAAILQKCWSIYDDIFRLPATYTAYIVQRQTGTLQQLPEKKMTLNSDMNSDSVTQSSAEIIRLLPPLHRYGAMRVTRAWSMYGRRQMAADGGREWSRWRRRRSSADVPSKQAARQRGTGGKS